MASKIDWELFLQNMLVLPEKNASPLPENLSYLMNAIVIPLLDGSVVPLSSLDYDRFEEDDLDSLEEYIENNPLEYDRLCRFNSEIDRLSPLCVPQSVFC